jgi:cytochrome c oxidase subunit 3
MSTATDSSVSFAHHFDTLEQAQECQRLGIWWFLITEVMFFGGVFVAYTAYRMWYPQEFEAGSGKLNVLIAGINSLLLLTSSLTITFAIHAAHEGNESGLKRNLLLTIFLALCFIGFKAREYQLDFEEHLVPGPSFASHEFEELKVDPKKVQLFFIFYYSMTGIHVAHMLAGIGIIAWLYMLAKKGFFKPKERYVYIEVASLYWHFVDLMWFFLVALLYVAGPHTKAQLHL